MTPISKSASVVSLKETTTYSKLMTKPLFKWTGGKGRLLQKYTDLNFFPDSSEFDTFVDLFFGAGSVTCWIADKYPDKKLIINDANTDMVNVYKQIRNNWDNFRDEYQRVVDEFLNVVGLDERKYHYNEVKRQYAWEYQDKSELWLTARLLVMLKINFNGIWISHYKKWNYRYGTPPGHMNYKERNFDITPIEEFREMLLRAEIYNCSFEGVQIPERAWVFADPPYRDTRKMYSDQFTDETQSQLAEFLQSQDCLYAESNKETGDGFWQNHFPPDSIHYLNHIYTCGQSGSMPVTEVLIKNYGEVLEPTNIEQFF
jgi:DNA adenine methylase